MTLSADDYVQKIVAHLTVANELLEAGRSQCIPSAGEAADVWKARSGRASAYASLAHEHNSIANTYVKLLEITTKAGTT